MNDREFMRSEESPDERPHRDLDDEIQDYFPSLRIRWLPRAVISILFPYVAFDNTDATLWNAAVRNIPVSHKLFFRSLPLESMDRLFGKSEPWASLRNQMRPTDSIHPFVINPYTSSGRWGYVVARGRRPLGGVVVACS